jgi:iron(III) transport system permease protein
VNRPTASGWAAALVRAAAVGLVVVSVVAPIALLFATSLRVTTVVAPDGRSWRAAGSPVPTDDGGVRFLRPSEDDPEAEPMPMSLPRGSVVREVWSTAHYRDVLRSRRTRAMVVHSVVVAGGGALLALLLGIPTAWLVARTTLPGRRVLAALLAAPILLPPFFHAMGVSDAVGRALSSLGFRGGSLQMANAVVCFGSILFPVAALLVGRALASVPRGLVEAATLAGGRGAALRRVVWPCVLPSALAAFTLAFVLALSDFAIPDLLGVFLPDRAVAVNVFATEVFLQWKTPGNTGRAVATGTPFVLATVALVALTAWLVRRSPVRLVGHAARPRDPVRLSPLGAVLGWALGLAVLGLALALPVLGIVSWGFSPARVPATVRATDGVVPQAARWLEIGLLAAAAATAAAVVLARWAVRGGARVRATVAVLGALPLAVPGMALMVGTLLLWVGVPTPPGTVWKPALLLAGRFLPYALLAAWLALREVDPRLEDAARLSGASAWTRLRRVTEPLSRRGWLSAFLLALLFCLREVDAIVLLEPGVLPVRIYEKVHFGKTGDVADLSMAYLAVLLVPAVLGAVLWGRRRREGGAVPAA